MSNLKFADTHNLVTFLSKPEESDGFEQIVDFLNARPIKYALTINPTIYTSCIEQFWSTIKAKTINGEVQLHAQVDGKKIIVTESTIRRDLQLEDAEGIDCLPNSTIFEELTRMGDKCCRWRLFYKELDDSVVRLPLLLLALEAERTVNVSKLSNDLLLARGNTLRSGEDSLKLNELMELCTNLQTRVLDLETTKTTQANNIASLKRRVKKIEKKDRSRTHKLKRLYKVGLSVRVESSRDEEDLGEGASKQGRRIHDIDADEDITLVNDDNEIFDVDALAGKEVFVAEQSGNVVEEVVAVIDAASIIIVSAATITDVEITLAQALAELKSAKPKADKVVIQEPEQVKPMKRLDEELVFKLQDEDKEEERLAREKAQQIEEASIA
ncbi:hypothetical protein Tco_0653687 [Tanacetum coccineum]|uniref:Xylulose kinase-1 n=1 Tax=Tanacetum coccineum TaxID=301880 RepID=A0ABQ4X148_9ASTR